MRRAAPWLLVGFAVVVVALLGGRGHHGGAPLDPRSTEPAGAKAVVLLARQLGARTTITSEAPGPGTTTALVLRDQLAGSQRAGVERWVAAGGTLVVADPLSSFAPSLERRPRSLFDPSSEGASPSRPRCSLPLLARVGRIESPDALPFRPPPGSVGCFPRGRGFVLVARPVGDGTVIAIGGAGLFANANLDEADNSVLAASVLGARPGAAITVLVPGRLGGGDKKLLDLVSARVKDGLWQLVIAFGVVVLWRSRRLGPPVLEPLPVDIPGSELVVAVGHLLEEAKRRDQAAAMLRSHLRRAVADRLGLAADAPVEAMAAAVGSRTAVPAERAEAVLRPDPVPTDADLVALSRAVERIRKEISHA
jgi:hypothetical protein